MSLLKQLKARKPAVPRVKGTKLGHALRQFAEHTDSDYMRLRATTAADRLDRAAIALGVKGNAVKRLAAYLRAKEVYADVVGEPYE